MMRRLAVVVSALALFALGVAAGALWLRPAPAERPTKAPVAAPKQRISDSGDEAVLAALRNRIAKLESQLAEAQDRQEEAVSNAVASAERERRPRWGMNLEEMKEKDPARYQQITNRMAQIRRENSARAGEQLDFLASVDTSRMSASARTTHANYQELIAKREELEGRLHTEGLTEEERGGIWKELHGTFDAMRMMHESERNVLVEEMAKNLGFEGSDAKLISTTVHDIIDATEPFNFRRHRGGHGGGHGGGRR